jgi:prepilin-type N-terminal cleavage/methylation domain-containing protein
MSKRKGFTLVELLVVIGIIALLISILLPSLNRAREMGRRAVCLSSMRQLATGWYAYANDNKGKIVGAENGPTGWVDNGNTVADLKRGLLFKYLQNPGVFLCPNDIGPKNIRSYSINSAMNGGWGQGIPSYKKLSQIPHTSSAFVFIEEYDPRGYNEGSFVLYNSGDQWVDYPVHWHSSGAVLSFADSHADYYHWDDPRTSKIHDFYAVTPNNRDLKRLQKVVGY